MAPAGPKPLPPTFDELLAAYQQRVGAPGNGTPVPPPDGKQQRQKQQQQQPPQRFKMGAQTSLLVGRMLKAFNRSSAVRQRALQEHVGEEVGSCAVCCAVLCCLPCCNAQFCAVKHSVVTGIVGDGRWGDLA